MNANGININQIFVYGLRLEVPFYQRAYVWTDDQWDRLLSDLSFITMTKRPYFLGSIILKQGESFVWDAATSRKIVVDGQQRLTTLLLFYKAYYLLTNDNARFDLRFRLSDHSVALALGLVDEEAFKMVMDQKEPREIKNYKSSSSIITAFNYFIKNIKKEDYNLNIIEQNLQFVCIELSRDEDEQQVFDTINSLGIRLTTAELLKNYFYSREDIKKYKETWVKVFENDDDIRSYWNTSIETGRMTRSLIDMFFDAYFQLFIQDSKYKVSTEDKIAYSRLERLSQSYQDFIKR